jgi:NMD protein affecting ribosome stability and mRNA decay
MNNQLAAQSRRAITEEKTMVSNVIKVICAGCGKEFLFAGTIESVPDRLCLDCFVEKQGEEVVGDELEQVLAD